MIKMPISEIADRLSIAILKDRRTFEDMKSEIDCYQNELDGYDTDVHDYVQRLIEVNGKIWDLEADIRAGREGELGLEEVGRRAIKIRGLNKVRVGIKNEMVEQYGEGFKDIKINHGSDG